MAESSTSSRNITHAELAEHKTEASLWIAVDGLIYDVTKFLEEHPGGEESITDVSGRDASGPFKDAGHSQDARELLAGYKIGVLVGDESDVKKPSEDSGSGSYGWLIPLGIALVAALVYRFVIKAKDV